MSTRLRLIVISGIAGAVLAGTAAWALSQAKQSKFEQKTAGAMLPSNHLELQAAPGDYVQIAVSLVGLVKQIAGLFRPA